VSKNSKKAFFEVYYFLPNLVAISRELLGEHGNSIARCVELNNEKRRRYGLFVHNFGLETASVAASLVGSLTAADSILLAYIAK